MTYSTKCFHHCKRKKIFSTGLSYLKDFDIPFSDESIGMTLMLQSHVTGNISTWKVKSVTYQYHKTEPKCLKLLPTKETTKEHKGLKDYFMLIYMRG